MLAFIPPSGAMVCVLATEGNVPVCYDYMRMVDLQNPTVRNMTGIGIEDGKIVVDISHPFEKTNIDREARRRKYLGFQKRRIAHRREFSAPATVETDEEGKSSSDSSSSSSDSHSSSSSSEEEKAKREAKAEIDEII